MRTHILGYRRPAFLAALALGIRPGARDCVVICASESDAIAVLAAAQVMTLPLKAEDALPAEFVWMPKGEHEISAFAADGTPWKGKIICDESGAQACQATLAQQLAAGHRVPLDKDHKDEEATAWVLGFRWDPTQGIMVKVEWTSLGEQLLRGKVYHSFSPAFLLNKQTSRVRGFPGGGHAAGGLVNAPAFRSAMPSLIAARLAGQSPKPASGGIPDNNHKAMKEVLIKILAALAVSHAADATEEQLVTLVTKHIDRLPEAGTEGQALKAQLAELESLKAKAAEVDTLKAKDLARRKADAAALVDKAVARGAIPAKDEAIQAKWRGMLESDPTHAELLAALPDNPALARVTQPGEGATEIQVNAKLLEHLKGYAKEQDHKKAAVVYARHIDAEITKLGNEVLRLMASNSLGTTAAAIITQRYLSLLVYDFPFLKDITTDFSDQGAKFNQPITTRLRTVPSVLDYNATTGYTTRSDAGTSDVSITIDKHKYCSIEFNATELGSTARDLFGEQAQPQLYAVGAQLVTDLLAKIVEGAGAFGTAGSQATQIANAAAFNAATLDTVAGALDGRKVSKIGRFALLDSTIWPGLRGDTRLVYLAGFQDRSIIENYDTMPKVSGFRPYNSPFLPTPTVNSSKVLHGFAGTSESLALATRLPADYTQALGGAAHGTVRTISDAGSGLAVMQTQYVNHDIGSAISRLALMYGAAVGNKLTGQLIAY